MAVIDQDSFSNISWQIEASDGMESAGSNASMPNIEAEPPSTEDQHHGQDLERQDPGLSGDILECAVSEPHKESDGTKDAFVSYLITTNVSMESCDQRRKSRHVLSPLLCSYGLCSY